MKTMILGLLLAALMFGETVHFGGSSKVYHKTQTCSARGKAHKLTSERTVAEAHGLRACKRCWAAAAAACTTDAECESKAKAKGNGAWATGAAVAK